MATAVEPLGWPLARFCELAKARLGRCLDLLAAGASAQAAAIHGELSSLAAEAAVQQHAEVFALAHEAEAAARRIPHDPAAVFACLALVRSLGRTLAVLEARGGRESRERPADVRPRAASRGRVLLVDDSKVSASMLSVVLSAEGFTVEIATNEPELERVLATFRPDLALSDVSMPGFDCELACRRVREVAPRARVVLYSSFGEEILARECERANADGFLSRERDLSAVVQRVIAETAGRR